MVGFATWQVTTALSEGQVDLSSLHLRVKAQGDAVRELKSRKAEKVPENTDCWFLSMPHIAS